MTTTHTNPSAMAATPARIKRTGAWGARVPSSAGRPAVGQVITITTRHGKSWHAYVSAIVAEYADATIVSTESIDRPAPSARASGRGLGHGGECRCGGTDDLLSFGYAPGQRVQCESCGGWGEAY
jgi:hypothetical protein